MAGRYTRSYLDRSSGWRAVATLADIGRGDDDNRTESESPVTIAIRSAPPEDLICPDAL
jgi:hypothetical protein